MTRSRNTNREIRYGTATAAASTNPSRKKLPQPMFASTEIVDTITIPVAISSRSRNSPSVRLALSSRQAMNSAVSSIPYPTSVTAIEVPRREKSSTAELLSSAAGISPMLRAQTVAWHERR